MAGYNVLGAPTIFEDLISLEGHGDIKLPSMSPLYASEQRCKALEDEVQSMLDRGWDAEERWDERGVTRNGPWESVQTPVCRPWLVRCIMQRTPDP